MPPPVAHCFAALQTCTHCTHSLSHCTDASTQHFVAREGCVCVRAPRGSPRDCRRQTPRPAPRRRSPPELLIRGCRFIFIAGRNRHPRPAARAPLALRTAYCTGPAMQPVRVRAASRLSASQIHFMLHVLVASTCTRVCKKALSTCHSWSTAILLLLSGVIQPFSLLSLIVFSLEAHLFRSRNNYNFF